MEDTKRFDLGRWGSFTVGGLAAALLTAGITQFTECDKEPAEPPVVVVDAGSDVIDAGLEEDSSVVIEDAGLELAPTE